jgi:hypothetical protein
MCGLCSANAHQVQTTVSTIGNSHVDVAGTIVASSDGINGFSLQSEEYGVESDKSEGASTGDIVIVIACFGICVVVVIVVRDYNKPTPSGNGGITSSDMSSVVTDSALPCATASCATATVASEGSDLDLWPLSTDTVVVGDIGHYAIDTAINQITAGEAEGEEEDDSISIGSMWDSTVHYSLCGA